MYKHVTLTILGCCFVAAVLLQRNTSAYKIWSRATHFKKKLYFFQSGLIQSTLRHKNITPCPVEIGEFKPLKYGRWLFLLSLSRWNIDKRHSSYIFYQGFSLRSINLKIYTRRTIFQDFIKTCILHYQINFTNN